MKLLKILPILILCIAIISLPADARIAYNENVPILYEMYVNGISVGTIEFAGQGFGIANKVFKELRTLHGSDSIINIDIAFKEITTTEAVLTNPEQIATAIRAVLDIQAPACGVFIDNELVFYVKSEDIADDILSYRSQPFTEKAFSSNDVELEDFYFKQTIEYVDDIVSIDRISTYEEALSILAGSNESTNDYTVRDSDTLWSIAIDHQIEVEDIEAENPEYVDGCIKPGDIIKLPGCEPILSVITKEKAILLENIEYETETRHNSSLGLGKTRVIQKGIKGVKKTTYLVYKENGRVTDREKIDEAIEKEPIKRIVEKGTKTIQSASTTYRGSVTRSDIVRVALEQEGKPYVGGGLSPSVGFDCSGLVWYVYKVHFGINIRERTAAGMAGIGTAVSKGDWLPGDIILLTSGGDARTNKVGHVGIYIGDYGGKKDAFIHARGRPSNPKKVEIAYLNEGNYPNRYKGARRIIQ